MPLWFERRDGEPLTDTRLGLPLCPPGETTPTTAWTAITADPTAMRTAISAGATGVLIPLDGSLEAAGRMAVALSVIEAELGLGDGDLVLMAVIGGPGAALALARNDFLPQRLLAIGADDKALLATSGEAGAATAAGLVALAAAARGVAAFVTNEASAPAAEPTWAGFALRLVASDNPPNGKNRPEA